MLHYTHCSTQNFNRVKAFIPYYDREMTVMALVTVRVSVGVRQQLFCLILRLIEQHITRNSQMPITILCMIPTHERFKRTLFIRTRQNQPIFRVIPFVKLQNKTRPLCVIAFFPTFYVFGSCRRTLVILHVLVHKKGMFL